MPTIYAASESSLQVNGEAVEGVRAIEYRHMRSRSNVYAIGQTERIGTVSGPEGVEGRLVLASASPALDDMGGTSFQLTASLRHGEATTTLTFDDCYLLDHGYRMAVGEHGESTYTFTATRVRRRAEGSEE